MSRPVPPHVAFTGLAVVFAAFFVAAGAPTPLLSLQQQAWGFSEGLVVVTGVIGAWLAVLWAGAVIGGFGFGGAFGGQVRIIAPRVQAHERAGVLANIYTVAYLAFGVPVAVAGQLVPFWGLSATCQLYAAVVVAVAAWGLATQVSRARHDAGARGAPEQHVTPGATGSRG